METWDTFPLTAVVRALTRATPENVDAHAHGRTVPGRQGPSHSDAPRTSSGFTRLRNVAIEEGDE